MKICVLLPDYSTTQVDYQYYDPPRNLAKLLPEHEVLSVLLNKLTTYKQLKQLSTQGFDIFVNLCEGYLEWEVPSIDVIYTLELLNLPFTGPSTKLYDPTKELMKYVAYCNQVATPAYVVVHDIANLSQQVQHLRFPLFVKPAKAGDSLGIDDHSLVHDLIALESKLKSLWPLYPEVLVEEYIDGREFTVLVAANPDGKTCTSFTPVEFVFPKNHRFKTYALKTSELHTDANQPVTDLVLKTQLQKSAEAIFTAFNGVGYARLDFRTNASGQLFFLEINFTCSVFYTDGYEGSADYILQIDGFGQRNFLLHIIQEGLARHVAKQKCYTVKGNAIAGYGIYANRPITQGDIVFVGEEKAQRMVTKKFVDQHYNAKQLQDFAQYAYPISQDVYMLWSNHPEDWAPQNHSCNANTAYQGLNVVATRNIAANEELTLDYASFLDETAEPFTCTCGASNCRGLIAGKQGNRIGLK